jgi:hypothetical protein
MAAGDNKIFRDFVLKVNEGAYNEGDNWRLAFVSNTYSTINVDSTNPVLANVTPLSGGNVAASYLLANFAITRATTTIKFDADDIATITKNASNPATVRSAVIYNDTSASDDLVCAFDLTTDGSTALDLVNNDFTFSFGAGGIITATVA